MLDAKSFVDWLRARKLGLAIIGVIVIAWVLFLRPYSLGGPVAYIKVAGGSMEPAFSGGDLVITQRQDAYGAGDVIAYRADRGIVLHRIVGGNAEDGFDTRGDAAPRADGWKPRPDQIIGKSWLHIPLAGTWFHFLQDPIIAAAIAGGITSFFIMAGGHRRPRAPVLVLSQRRVLNIEGDEEHKRAA